MIHLLSLGAGVQSSAMALMAAVGEITPMPSAAIFADTQAEPKSVYRWLAWLKDKLPFPVYCVTKGSLEDTALDMKTTKDGRKFSKTDIPFFTRHDDGSQGMIPHRSCTQDFKIAPIEKKAKEIADIKRGEKKVRVTQWIGISLDEAQRMKPARKPWIANRFPLVEMRMRRSECLAWMDRNDYPSPPRSACVFCPFHGDSEWRRLKQEEPQEFERAIQFERRLQKIKAESDNFDTTPYLHSSRRPLDEIDFSNDLDHGQQLLWGNECEGMCGL